MNYEQKKEACKKIFDALAEELRETYEVVGSCNQDISEYLIPAGTISDLSYYGKPGKSFRFSDHWNWYSSLKKCVDPDYIQCLSLDLPKPKQRLEEGKASKPIFGIQVALIGDDGNYHVVYGEKFDRQTRRWSWVKNDIKDILAMI